MPSVLPDVWTWDMWFADDGENYHVFYLKAPRSLGDPGLRHHHASVGHAVSADLRTWHDAGQALAASEVPAYDDHTTWTGSVVRGSDGTWRMFYTGTSRADNGLVQRVGVATSPDLHRWEKASTEAVGEADPRWYEKYDGVAWFDEAWRDPWVFSDPGGEGWHMLVTARANHGDPDDRGVIGHATSPDLATWTIGPPLSAPGAGFGQLEVPQIASVDGRDVLVFSCLSGEMSRARRLAGESGGVWSVPVDSPRGPYDITRATRLTDESLYAGRLIQDRSGSWWLFAFHNIDTDGQFGGTLSEPMPVGWSPEGRLHVTDGRFADLT